MFEMSDMFRYLNERNELTYCRVSFNIVAMFENYEFIQTRSYEIAWAVFRCAALVKQPKLKEELENGAVEITVNYNGYQKGDKGFGAQIETLKKLESIIKLAEAVGEIKAINAQVLYRELINLDWAISRTFSEIRKEAEKSADIDDIFAKLPMTLPNFKNNSANREKDGVQAENNSARELHDSAKLTMNNNSAILRQAQDKVVRPPAGESPQVIRQELGKNSAKTSENPLDAADSWQNTILNKVQDLEETSTKELSVLFPQISERTIRFYLQKLTEKGFIRRIGNPGPGSYYQAV